MDKQPYIVGVGAANADLNGASLAPIHLRDSNPGHISLSAGGVTRNVCENLARLGADVKLLSCVGDDTFGAFIRRSCEDAGIDASHLYEARGASSSMYLSILDADGDMLVGMSDMRIVQQDIHDLSELFRAALYMNILNDPLLQHTSALKEYRLKGQQSI